MSWVWHSLHSNIYPDAIFEFQEVSPLPVITLFTIYVGPEYLSIKLFIVLCQAEYLYID